MLPQLTSHEVRVIACLLEKQVTTPEQYPLSLNALQSACNQKSNREPVLELAESEVQAAIDSLVRRHLVLERSGFGSRVPKYQQRFCNTEFSSLQLSAQERAVLCELMLRGPQTPGELRSRAARMAGFADVAEVESTLQALVQRADGALVVRLARESGRRELRYMHLVGPERPASPAADEAETDPATSRPGSTPLSSDPGLEARVRALELQVSRLIGQLEALQGGSGA
jgi:hypothetical protein